SWLMSSDCPLNGETLVAGAGAVRPAARIEGPGLIFTDEITPDDLKNQAGALMDMMDWRTFSDGNAAFDQLMSAVLDNTPMK
ncbi:MAG TPA: short-chain dehydrogenase, partial [Brevundimonas sp.]|nr:short-chain dehydrogenase [Brevundimonas sp.]